MHEIEICDFVIECGENRIAAKMESGGEILDIHSEDLFRNDLRFWFYILFTHRCW